MQRRDFLKLSATAGAVSCVAACGSKDSAPVVASSTAEAGEQLNWTACLVNCGSNCPLKVYSKDGVVTRVETDWSETDEYGNHQVRACLRGRSLRQRNYAPDRLKKPLKRRPGTKRGEGVFDEISWEQAFSEIGGQLKQIRQDHGHASIYHHYVSGAYYSFSSGNCIRRALSCSGGFLNYYSNYSWAALNVASPATFGTGGTNGTRLSEIRNSDFFLGIGFNPFEMRMSGSGEQYDFLNAINDRRANGKLDVYFVDPRYTDSTLGKEDKWLAIRPGTDAAFAEAVAYQMINSGWVEKNSREFLDKFAVGYDRRSIEKALAENPELAKEYGQYVDPADNYHDHIMGLGKFAAEGAKTPEWAERVTGIPAEEIIDTANKLMAAKAPYISIGAAPNRQANGEQTMRALYMLSVLTGKIGQSGVNSGELPKNFRHSAAGMGYNNPVKEQICFFDWVEAIENGTKMSYRSHAVKGLVDAQGNRDIDKTMDSNIKAVFCSAGNALVNQHADINKTRAVLEREDLCELIVVTDCWLTASAKMADYVLPDTSWLESNDLADDSYASGETGYQTYMSTSLKPFFDCKSMYEIGLELTRAQGGDVEAYTEGRKSEQEWLDHLYAKTRENPANAVLNLPATYKEAQQTGFFRRHSDSTHVAMQDFVNGEVKLATPSGKIEMYSFTWAKAAHERTPFQNSTAQVDQIEPIGKYVKHWQGFEDEATRDDFPFQVVGYHTKGRTHSSYHNVEWLREAVEDCVWINPVDANGFNNGQQVIVESPQGAIEVRLRITPRVAPGVVAMAQGAWYKGDKVGSVDKGGCTNVLTKYHPGPYGRGNTQHTIRVKLKPAQA